MKRALLFGAAAALAACGGDSSTGGGTSDSPFIGTYKGSSTVILSTATSTRTASEPISIFVHRDGLVQFGNDDSIIYASGPLQGHRLEINSDATMLVGPKCTGIITLTGIFALGANDKAKFKGNWSSDNASCFATAGELEGQIAAERVNQSARASRVFETNSPALLEVFRTPADYD